MTSSKNLDVKWHNISGLFHLKLLKTSVPGFSIFGTLGPLGPHKGVQMGVKLISMHFRHHNLETEENDISKLNFRIRANVWFLAGLYVKGTNQHTTKDVSVLLFLNSKGDKIRSQGLEPAEPTN